MSDHVLNGTSERDPLPVDAAASSQVSPSQPSSASGVGLQELISPELFGAALRIFEGVEDPIPVYLHEPPGDVRIGGGSAGPQTIQTLSIHSQIRPWMEAVFLRLDELLELDFMFSPTSNASKINVYLDTTIDLGGGGTTLGVALSNEFRRSSWWEIILNGPPLLNDLDYFQFAFVHELGHVLGLEHPFDGSDGDLGGVRFGAPDASVTAMSYTEPVDGWPDFYRPSDLAALVSLWGLESDVADWLITDAGGDQLLLEREEAEDRLALLVPGDALLGPAPAAPEALSLSRSSQDGSMNLTGFVEQGSWELSWDGGLSWIQGNGTTLDVESPALKQLMLRQTDQWGRLSPELTVLLSREQLVAVTPELLLPAADAPATGLTPLMAGPDGDPVLFWSLDPVLAPLAEQIRAAVAEVDALLSLDFLELEESDAEALPQPLVQLSFRAADDDAPLLSLDRRIRTSEPLLLEDRLDVWLKAGTAATAPTSFRQALLQGLGHAVGLQGADPALLPGTTVMAALQESFTVADEAGLTDLDREALLQLFGPETDPTGPALADLATGPAVIRIGAVSARFRDESNGQSTTILELPVQRSGNLDLRVPLLLQTGTAQTTLVLEPGASEGLWSLELPSGQAPELMLEALLPQQARLEEGSNTNWSLDLHALELALTPNELIAGGWQSQTDLIGWHLDPALESAWGPRLRPLLQAIDAACGLTLVEVPADHALLSWQFKPAGAGLSDAPGVFELGADPAALAPTGIGSAEQVLLQNLLLALGLERPDDPSDGDLYQRTPVYPEDSALFTALRDGAGSGETMLRPIDRQALAALHGPEIPPSPAGSAAPSLTLALNTEQTGQRLTAEGLKRQLTLSVIRNGLLSGGNRLLLRESQLGLAELVTLEPNQARAEIELPWPVPTTHQALQFELDVLSGGYNTAESQLSVTSSLVDLNQWSQQLLPDPITGWTPDVDGDGSFQPQLEGQLLLRFAFGTFPGHSLTDDLDWPAGSTSSAGNLLQVDERAAEASQWVSTGLSGGLPELAIDSLMQNLHNFANSPVDTTI